MRTLKKWLQDTSLKNKIILINGLGILIMFLGAVLGIGHITDNYNDLIYRMTLDNLKLSTTGIDERVREIEKLSEYLVTDDTVQKELERIMTSEYILYNNAARSRITSSIHKYNTFDSAIISISVLDYKDQQISSSSNQIFSDDILEECKNLAEEYDGKAFWYVPLQEEEDVGTIICVRAVKKIEGLSLNYLGSIMIRIDLAQIVEENLYNLLRGDDLKAGKIFIFHNSKVIYPINEKWEGDFSQIDQNRGYSITTIDRIKYLMTFNALEGTELTYALLIPYDKVYAASQSSQRVLGCMGAILLIITIIISILLVSGVLNHIQHLMDQMRQFKGENTIDEEEYKKYIDRKDEIGFLHQGFYEMAKDIHKLINEGLKKQILIQDAQIGHLVSQINPHFLYNTLNSINWIAKMNRQTKISEMVEALGMLMRTAISGQSDLIPLGKELELVQGYIFIQKVRYEERLDFAIEVEEELLDIPIPKLCIQPLVENSINHVLEDMLETCVIKVEVERHDKDLVIKVLDNGPGVEPDILGKLQTGEVKPKHTGIGLGNIQRRIEILYGEEYGLSFERLEQGASVNIHISVDSKEEDFYVKCHGSR